MFRYNIGGGEIIEIIIRDGIGSKIDSYKFRLKDIDRFKSVLKSIQNKYGINIYKKKKPTDIDWLKKTEW